MKIDWDKLESLRRDYIAEAEDEIYEIERQIAELNTMTARRRHLITVLEGLEDLIVKMRSFLGESRE